MSSHGLYRRAPVPLQHAISSSYGARELLRRHTGTFRRQVRDLEDRQWWPAERLRADQDARVRAMVTWCAARVPHYRDLFSDLQLTADDLRGADDLRLLPLLDKETVRGAPERFLPSAPVPRLVRQTTGGTTGTPLACWATLDAVRTNYATYEARARRWAGVRFGERMASFQGQPVVPSDQQAPPFWRWNVAFRQMYCSVYHLSAATLPAYVAALERFDPVAITGYPSAVARVAEHLLDTGDVGRLRPRAVILSGETAQPSTLATVEAAFGASVVTSYGLGELVAFVSSCADGGLHVSSEYGALELVDVDGTGTTEIVATGLINKGMPLLRYRTGDTASPAAPGPCACGRHLPRLAELEGRRDDVVHTPTGARIGPAPMSLSFQRVPHLRRAQVLQDRVDELTILVEVDPDWGRADEQVLLGELDRRLGGGLRIRIEQVRTIPRTGGGKERLVVSSLDADGSRAGPAGT